MANELAVNAAQSKQPPKEMLTWTKTANGHHVRINYSSLDLLQTCPRKAHYSLNLSLRQQQESDALAFGSAIHKALEHWYQLPVSERILPASLYEDADMLPFQQGNTSAKHGALEAIRQFVVAKKDILGNLPDDDKRSLTSGIRILKLYFKRYADDGFVVAADSSGPLIERKFSFIIYQSPTLTIEYFGTIDVVLRNEQTGLLMVADHKTTASLGKEFFDRCKPNPQYTGYVMGAKKALGIDTNLFMINGIQTAKTKTEFARQVTERSEEDFVELKDSVVYQVTNWMALQNIKSYPQSSPGPCSNYGGCQYRPICEVPNKVKQNVIAANYGAKT